jgi:hypothetical protein
MTTTTMGRYHIILLLLGLFSVLDVGRSQGTAKGDSHCVKVCPCPVLLRGVILSMTD